MADIKKSEHRSTLIKLAKLDINIAVINVPISKSRQFERTRNRLYFLLVEQIVAKEKWTCVDGIASKILICKLSNLIV